MIVACSACGHENSFEQPYAYHAGFGNQGFLYNDAGNRTLVWSSFDPAWESLIGQVHPWTLGSSGWDRVEAALAPLPDGTQWKATNPPRCTQCGAAIGRPISSGEIYYLVFPESLVLDEPAGANEFRELIRRYPGSDLATQAKAQLRSLGLSASSAS